MANKLSIGCFALFLSISTYVPALSQKSNGALTAEKIGLFLLPELEPSPKTHAPIPDTANFKPRNFIFPNIGNKSLKDLLEKDVPLPSPACKPSWGLFVFRVNALGKVDSTWFRGELASVTVNQIIKNIYATNGLWKIHSDTKPTNVAWFVYPFFDTRGAFDRKLKCSKTDKSLQHAVASLASLVFQLYFQVDNNYNRATMVAPTQMDGLPKM